MQYNDMPLDEAYRLINTGPVVLVSSVSRSGQYDVAPIAWACPAQKSPSRVLVGIGRRHKTFINIEETGEFVVSVPNISQVEMVTATGSVSGADVDKFAELNIEAIDAKTVDCKIPEGVIGYLECKLVDIYGGERLGLVVGEAVAAAVDAQAYNGERMLCETQAGKAVHHLGERRYMTLGDEIIQ